MGISVRLSDFLTQLAQQPKLVQPAPARSCAVDRKGRAIIHVYERVCVCTCVCVPDSQPKQACVYVWGCVCVYVVRVCVFVSVHI
jgi:hypothetical protein